MSIAVHPRGTNADRRLTADSCCRRAARLRCRAEDEVVSQQELSEFEVVEDAEELDVRDQNGANYLNDEVLSMITPETVPTPIFDSMEVRIGRTLQQLR